MYFNKYSIETNYSKSEIIDKLKAMTYTDKLPFFRYNFTEKPFIGKINEETFSIYQVVKGRNSFIPMIDGQIVSGPKNVILLKMRLHYAVILFTIFFTFFSIFLQIVVSDFEGWVIAILAYGMTIFFYIVECRVVKKIFDDNFGVK